MLRKIEAGTANSRPFYRCYPVGMDAMMLNGT